MNESTGKSLSEFLLATYNGRMAYFISSNHVIQAVIIGGVFAFLTAILIINAKIKSIVVTTNGWRSTLKCARPGSGILLRAASAKFLPGVNVAEEAMYWITTSDSIGHPLNSRQDYLLHFDAGQAPPNDAFWSLRSPTQWGT
jgi:hypothetical protein